MFSIFTIDVFNEYFQSDNKTNSYVESGANKPPAWGPSPVGKTKLLMTRSDDDFVLVSISVSKGSSP